MELYNIKEVANKLRVSNTKVYQLVEHKRIGHYRLDGRILFSPDHLSAYLKLHEVQTGNSNEDT